MTAAITPRTRTIVLLQGDDDERLEELRAVAKRLREKAGTLEARAERLRPRRGQPGEVQLLGDDDPWAEAKEAAEAAAAEAEAAEQAADSFAEEAKGRAVTVVMRSIGFKKWKSLAAKHPPREDNEHDAIARYNIDTAPDDLVPPCLASPSMDDDEKRSFLEALSFGNFDKLAWAAHALNTGRGADPTLRLLSASGQISDETSSSPSALA